MLSQLLWIYLETQSVTKFGHNGNGSKHTQSIQLEFFTSALYHIG